MASKVALAVCLLLVLSSASVMGREILGTPYINHWLRNFATPDASACTKFGDLVADPDNCHNYYVCMAAGHVFSDVQTCDAADFDCFDPKSPADPTKSECLSDVAICEPICASTSQCALSCTGTNGFAVKQDDCTKYTQCFTTIDIGRTCPVDTPYFNGQECGTDPTACCTCKLATCTELGDLIPDPKNCHQFYMCDASLTALGPLLCPNGGSFVNGACEDTTTCTDPCPTGSEVSTSTSTITTTISSDKTTTTSIPTSCIDLSDFICPANGFYAHCSYCDSSFFKCDNAASTPTLRYCAGDTLFNPNPNYPFCISPENCPFGN